MVRCPLWHGPCHSPTLINTCTFLRLANLVVQRLGDAAVRRRASGRGAATPDRPRAGTCGSAALAYLGPRQRYSKSQEDQLVALGLPVNVVVLWNTIYMDAALNQLRAEGFHVRDEDAARLSSFGSEHSDMLAARP